MNEFYNKYVKKVMALPNTDHLHNCSFYCGNYLDLSETDIQIIGGCIS